MLKKLSLNKICLTVLVSVSLLSCSDAPDVHPTVVDFQLNEARVYPVIDKKNFTLGAPEVVPIETADGYYCLSQKETALAKDYLINNCTCK